LTKLGFIRTAETFPLNPLQIEASTRTHINETRHAHLDQLHDSAVTLNQVSNFELNLEKKSERIRCC
jgi:hypothetical protein